MAIKKTKLNKLLTSLGVARIALGLVFLWSFFDKLLGLGFSTCRNTSSNSISMLCDKAWLQGGSPTSDFLQSATRGPFSELYGLMANKLFIDALFMMGLLGIGLALTLGIATKIATASGSLMMLMMYLALLPPNAHPFIDQHIIYIIVFMTIYFADEQKLGLSKYWRRIPIIKRLTWLH